MFNIIPQPVSILINRDRKGFTLHAGTTISPYPFAEDFALFVRKTLNKNVYLHEDTGEERSIILKTDENFEYDEGYTIKCENRRVFVTAKDETGLFYGLQTLKQMLLQTEGKLPYTEIIDYPRFPYRGFMIDCKRNLLTTEEVKRLIDLISLHKLNRLRIKDNGRYTDEEKEEIIRYCETRKIRVTEDAEENVNSDEYPYALDFPYGWNTLKKVCNDDGAINGNETDTKGIEARLSTDFITDRKTQEYFLFPRLGAMAENAWAERGFPSFTTFVHKAPEYYRFLDALEVEYAPLKKACPSFLYKWASSLTYRIKKGLKLRG